jgi:dolichol kinase
MPLMAEIKRKLFHHLSLVYMILYAVLPRWAMILLLGLALLGAGIVEFLRLRRPEINAWLLEKFGGIHRDAEIMAPSGIFWTMAGCWLTMVVFVDKLVGITGIGFLVFGDTAAALVGQAFGKHHWKKNPTKTVEGSAAFAGVSFLWGLLMVRPHGALIGALVTAWVESLPLRANDNFWIPLVGAFSVSVCFGGKLIRGNPYVYLLSRTFAFSLAGAAAAYGLVYYQKKKSHAS